PGPTPGAFPGSTRADPPGSSVGKDPPNRVVHSVQVERRGERLGCGACPTPRRWGCRAASLVPCLRPPWPDYSALPAPHHPEGSQVEIPPRHCRYLLRRTKATPRTRGTMVHPRREPPATVPWVAVWSSSIPVTTVAMRKHPRRS